MKANTKILFISVSIACFLLGSLFYYKYRQAIIEQLAKESFAEAVNNEAYKRIPDTEFTLTAEFTCKKIQQKGTSPQCVVWYDNSSGRKNEAASEKYLKNVTMNLNNQMIHSYAFEKLQVHPDSLNSSWQKLLKKENLVCHTGICLFSIVQGEKVIFSSTSDSKWRQKVQPFWTCTIGYHCEIECLLYLRYSLWQTVGLIGVGLALFYIFFILTIYKVAVIVRKKMDPVEIVIEKKILIKEMEGATARLYHLKGDIYFDAEKRALSEGENIVYLKNQCAELFELFLNENDQTLSIDAIESALWKEVDANCKNRIYQVINRLRASLKQFPSLSIDKISVGKYQLIISIV